MKTRSSSVQNKAGARVHNFFKHHEITTLTKLDHDKPDFIKNASNGVKLRKATV